MKFKFNINNDSLHSILLFGTLLILISLISIKPIVSSISYFDLYNYLNLFKNPLLLFTISITLMIYYILIVNYQKEKDLNKSLIYKQKELDCLNNIVDNNIISSLTDLNGNIIDVTESFLKLYGYKKEEVIGKSHSIVKSPKMPLEIYKDLWLSISQGKTWECELLNIDKNGKEIWVDTIIIPEKDEKTNQIIRYRAIAHDITDQKVANFLSEYDGLTNLTNKNHFDLTLTSSIIKAELNNKKLAIVFIDIDNFKDINEKYGYFGGDQVLKIISNRIKNIISDKDLLSRYSGDEFTLLIENLDENYEETILHYINKINKKINENIIMNNEDNINLTTSIGVSIFPKDGNKSIDLIKNADTAMLYAKNNGKNSFKIFNEEIFKIYQRKILIEDTLSEYIKNKNFYLLYQPKYDLKTKKIIGAEALIRMKDNVFYPNEFISIAEKTNKITEITKIVIENVVRDLKKIDLKNKKDFNISINLSAKDLIDNSILYFLLNECEKNNIDHSLISIEITEYTLMKNIDKTIKILQNFRDKNIDISIDDFGTGYSSMNYLKLLPINVIKIDKSFIDNIDSNIKDQYIVEAMINLSKSLKLNIVVEGIETNAQEDLLNKIGCKSGQGYLFSKPILFEEFKNKIIND